MIGSARMPTLPQAEPQSETPDLPGFGADLDEHQQLIAWEFLMCLDLGFSIAQSQALIEVPHFSWHSADDLITAHPTWPLATVVDELT